MKKLIVFAMITLTACSTSIKSSKNSTITRNTKVRARPTINANQEKSNAENQAQLALDDQLVKLKLENSENVALLKSNYDQLVHCQTDLKNPLLDGNSETLTRAEENAATDPSKMIATFDLDEQGLPESDTQEIVQDKINRQNQYSFGLKSNIGVLRTYLDNCLVKMGIARIKHGLKPTWYSSDPSKGYEQEKELSIGFSNAAKDKPHPVPDFAKSITVTPPF